MATTYNNLYLDARHHLREAGVEGAQLEARELVCAAAGKSREQYYRDMALYASDAVEEKLKTLVERRLAGEPVAYIIGEWEFYGLTLAVNRDVLIPRMDTELLVDTAKEMLTGRQMDARILDLCCGSGCITCAIGHELPATRLEICRKNIATNRLSSRAICVQADATASPPLSMGQFDMIISNPPYIASDEIMTLDPSVRDFEPIWALDGGPDGLKFYKAIIKYWKALLRSGGALLFEVGEGQAEPVKEMLLAGGFRSVSTRLDTLGVERVVIGIM